MNTIVKVMKPKTMKGGASKTEKKPAKEKKSVKKGVKNASKSVKPKTKVTKPKEKKIYDKPGQKKDTPPPSDPLYKFYTSLYKQNKNSKMAMQWCLEHGVFTPKKAAEVELLLKMEKMKIK